MLARVVIDTPCWFWWADSAMMLISSSTYIKFQWFCFQWAKRLYSYTIILGCLYWSWVSSFSNFMVKLMFLWWRECIRKEQAIYWSELYLSEESICCWIPVSWFISGAFVEWVPSTRPVSIHIAPPLLFMTWIQFWIFIGFLGIPYVSTMTGDITFTLIFICIVVHNYISGRWIWYPQCYSVVKYHWILSQKFDGWCRFPYFT